MRCPVRQKGSCNGGVNSHDVESRCCCSASGPSEHPFCPYGLVGWRPNNCWRKCWERSKTVVVVSLDGVHPHTFFAVFLRHRLSSHFLRSRWQNTSLKNQNQLFSSLFLRQRLGSKWRGLKSRTTSESISSEFCDFLSLSLSLSSLKLMCQLRTVAESGNSFCYSTNKAHISIDIHT